MIKLYSPNMLKTYELCPQKFYFKYIEKISMPTNDAIFEFGKNIHALASYYLKKENIDKLEKSLDKKENIVWQYLKNNKYFAFELIETEYNLSFKLNDIFLGGRIDALVKKDEKYYILDYKTGSIPKDVKTDYQTMIYMLAVSYYYNTNNINFIYLDLKNKTEVCIEFSEELKIKFLKKIETIINKIINEEFSKKTNKCNCEYSIICY